MLTRALIVLLLAFNLGVAGWWLLRAPPSQAVAPPQPQGVPRLQMPGEGGPPGATGATSAGAERPGGAMAAPRLRVEQCLTLGPFPDAASADRARVVLQPQVAAITERRVYRNPPRGWRVYLPPFADLAQAEAAAQGVAAAGFTDYFVVRGGAEANSLALGRYANQATAAARAETLSEAGFPAQAAPINSGPFVLWLDLTASADLNASRAQQSVQALEVRSIPCTDTIR